MVPQHVVPLDAIPLLPNGKVDRKALPKPSATRQDAGERLAPRNEREALVLQTMERVLNLPGLGIRDDFFSLGGHSLLAARLTTLLSRELSLTVPLRMLFEAPTAERLAAAIEGLERQQRAAQRADRAHGRSPQRAAHADAGAHPLRRGAAPGPADLQRALGAPPRRAAGRRRSSRRRCAMIIERQPSLRTAIGPDPATGEPAALIASEVNYELPVIDLGDAAGRPARGRAGRAHARAGRAADRHPSGAACSTRRCSGSPRTTTPSCSCRTTWSGTAGPSTCCRASCRPIYGALVRGEPHGLPPLAVTHGDYADWYASG